MSRRALRALRSTGDGRVWDPPLRRFRQNTAEPDSGRGKPLPYGVVGKHSPAEDRRAATRGRPYGGFRPFHRVRQYRIGFISCGGHRIAHDRNCLVGAGPRRRGLHIPRFAWKGKVRSFHRSASPTQTRFAGLCVGGRLRRPLWTNRRAPDLHPLPRLVGTRRGSETVPTEIAL